MTLAQVLLAIATSHALKTHTPVATVLPIVRGFLSSETTPMEDQEQEIKDQKIETEVDHESLQVH